MRERKAKAGALIPPETEDYWEQYRIAVLNSQPVYEWERQAGIWHALHENHHTPAAARRIAFAAITICAERGEAMPHFLLKLIAKTFKIEPNRNAPKKGMQLRDAVQLLLGNPKISDNELAKRIGVSRKTVYDWRTMLHEMTAVSDLFEYTK